MLLTVYPPRPQPKKCFALKSTHTVMGQLLDEIAAAKN